MDEGFDYKLSDGYSVGEHSHWKDVLDAEYNRLQDVPQLCIFGDFRDELLLKSVASINVLDKPLSKLRLKNELKAVQRKATRNARKLRETNA